MRVKKICSMMMALLMAVSLVSMVSAAPNPTEAFTDVPDTHMYKTAIEFCREKGFVLGVSPTTFAPDSVLSRAQLVTIWCRTLQHDDANHEFNDVTPLRKYYDTPVIVMRSLGIIKGTTDTVFSPGSEVTREELAIIAARTYALDEANADDYKRYADAADISDWAQKGVNACLNAEVFDGLYDGEDFLPAKGVTRAEICKLIYNISLPYNDITIGTITGEGTVSASHTRARAGTEITLTVKPGDNMRLKGGTLQYNGTAVKDYSFTMPGEDVVITAEFEPVPAPVLVSISLDTAEMKTTYTQGETLSLTGLVVTAKYSDNSEAVLSDGYTSDPAAGSTLSETGPATVTIEYTENEITVTNTLQINVTEENPGA